MILVYLAFGIILAIMLLLWREERRLKEKVKTIQKKIFQQNLYSKMIQIIPYTVRRIKNETEKEYCEEYHSIPNNEEIQKTISKKVDEGESLFFTDKFKIDSLEKKMMKKYHLNGRIDYYDNYKYIIRCHQEIHTITVDIPVTELILSKRKTEEYIRFKSTILSNMSSEVYIILNKMWRSCQTLIVAKKKEEYAQHIDELVQNTNLFLKRITEVISLSEVESSYSKHLTDSEIESVELLVEAKDMLSMQLKALKKEDSIQIDYFDIYQKFIVYHDKNHSIHVMNTFLNNAIEYTFSGSIKYGVVAGKNYYIFFVKDTGVGISKDRIHKVFTRNKDSKFFSLQHSLGLYVSKKIVLGKKGKIGVISQEGVGSLFWVFFPYVATYELNENFKSDKNELHDITEQIIRCDDLKDLKLENPF